MFEKSKRVEMDGRAKSHYLIPALLNRTDDDPITNELTDRRIKAKESIN